MGGGKLLEAVEEKEPGPSVEILPEVMQMHTEVGKKDTSFIIIKNTGTTSSAAYTAHIPI